MSHCPGSAHIFIYHSCWAVGLGCLVSFGAGAPDASECVLDTVLFGKGFWTVCFGVLGHSWSELWPLQPTSTIVMYKVSSQPSHSGVNLDQGCCDSPGPQAGSGVLLPSKAWEYLCFLSRSEEMTFPERRDPGRSFLAARLEGECKLSLMLSLCTLQISHFLFPSNNMWWPFGKSLVLNFFFMEAAVKTLGPLIGRAGTSSGCKSLEHWLDSVDRFLGSVKLSFPK